MAITSGLSKSSLIFVVMHGLRILPLRILTFSFSSYSSDDRMRFITIRRKVSAGELPCVRLTKGGPMRFDLRDIERFIAEHKS